jgi:hypothetical protein
LPSFSGRQASGARQRDIHASLVLFIRHGVADMTTLPLWAWFAGDAVLGIVMAYGIMRNRARTRGERIATNEATKELYSASCEAVSSDEG